MNHITKIAILFIIIIKTNTIAYSQWQQMNGPIGGNFNAIEISGSNLWISGQKGGIFYSPDSGQSWQSKGLAGNRINTIFHNGNTIFAATDVGVYKSSNSGVNWIITPVLHQNIVSFIQVQGKIFAGDGGGLGVVRSTNNGVNWDTVNNGLSNKYVNILIYKDSTIYAGTDAGVFFTTNYGLNWINLNNTKRIDALTYKDSTLYAGGIGTGYGIWKTTNNGINWSRSDNGISQPNIHTLFTNSGYILAGTYSQALFKSTNNGVNWIQISNGIKSNQIMAVKAVDSMIVAASGYYYNGLFISYNNGASFQECGILGVNVNYFRKNANKVFAICQNGIFLSTNDGENWSYRSMLDTSVSAFLHFNSEYYIGIGTSGCFKSTNDCQSWTITGLQNKGIYSLNSVQSKIFAGVTNEGLYVTSNGGVNWTKMQSELSTYSVAELCEIGTELFAGTKSNGLFKSTNSGLNWTAINNGLPTTNKYTARLFTIDSNLYAQMADVLDNSRIYKSTNKGNDWTEINPAFWGWFRKMEFSNTNFFMPSYEGIFVSTNSGLNWTQKNEGMYNLFNNSVIVSNGYLLTGTGGNSVWRRTIQQLIGITNLSTEIPSCYALEQNYPNPFNSSTSIKFKVALCHSCGGRNPFVTLKVFDLLGREVKTLVNEMLQPGTYSVRFEAGDLASGIYFYQLRANDFSETKKLILLK